MMTSGTGGDEGRAGGAGGTPLPPRDAASLPPRDAPQPSPRDAAPLSSRDVAVLGVERRSWPGPGAKERAIRERLGISPTRYYQLLNALLDDPRALAHDPVTVNRLRRLRESRRARR
ncbi:DUF3263 domain-containing protein [Streptomyces sp. NPDC003077]|uniref:DUF3263 domain-containing protein n=1 Tax=Streptomyces sp. NPDC003077 TaxID=3154443 RepID=UPI0033BD4BFE